MTAATLVAASVALGLLVLLGRPALVLRLLAAAVLAAAGYLAARHFLGGVDLARTAGVALTGVLVLVLVHDLLFGEVDS